MTDAERTQRPDQVPVQPIDWIQSAAQILGRLEGVATPPDEHFTAVLFAETTAFPGELRPRLVNSLYRFIEQYRFARDEETITTVGAAIRKYAMNMHESDFDRYAAFFLTTQAKTLSCEVQLELAKAVSWRMLYVPFDTKCTSATLGRRLVQLAAEYMKPGRILQENHAAIVLDAVLAAILLDAPEVDTLLQSVADLNVEWFQELLFDRMHQEAMQLTA